MKTLQEKIKTGLIIFAIVVIGLLAVWGLWSLGKLLIRRSLGLGDYKNPIYPPDEITIYSCNNKNIGQIKELELQLEDLEKKSDSQKDQNRVSQEINQLILKSTLTVNDREFIDKVTDEVINILGTKQGSTSKDYDKLIFKIGFPEYISSQNTTYTCQALIFSDKTALIQTYDTNPPHNLINVKVRISKDIIKYISDYYNSKI